MIIETLMKFLNSALAPLQAAQQERSTFISSLVPILSEYGMQPSAHDAQSIVSNLKVGFSDAYKIKEAFLF